MFVFGFIWGGPLLGLFYSLAWLGHSVHDTLDKNFDGVLWTWPFGEGIYKIRWHLEKKTAEQLHAEALIKNEKPRTSEKILADNI
jgi:hypothetical protein